MKRVKTRAAAMTLAASVIFAYGIFPQDIAKADDAVSIYRDFENESPSSFFDSAYGAYAIKKADNASEGMFLFDNWNWETTSGEIDLGKTISSGVIRLKFDYKVTTYTNRFYIRMFEGSGSDVAETFADRGSFAFYPNTVGWEIDDKRAEYDVNEWNTVEMYVNFDTRLIYYFANGDMYGFTTIQEPVSDAKKFSFVCNGSYGDTYIDNIYIDELKGDDESLPEIVKQDEFVDVKTDNAGRIFFDKNEQGFKVTAGNRGEKACDRRMVYKVLKNGREIKSYDEDIHIEPGETIEKDITVKADGYGYYYLKAELCDNDGNVKTSCNDYRFSVANAVGDELRDETMGIQMQTNVELNRNDVQNIDLPLIGKLGFSYTRGGIGWEGSVPAPNVFQLSEWSNWAVSCIKDKGGMEDLPVLSFGNANVTPENPPRSEYALEQFAWYAQQVCIYYEKLYGHPLKDIDVWNEYWMEGGGFNPDCATPEDYANMLKAVYPAVKEVSPTTTVWGLSGAGFSHLEWTERILKAGGGDYMDGYSLHPYYNKGLPEKANFEGIAKSYKDLFAKYGYTDKKVWVSEWGWPSCGEDGYPDERQQASYFVRANIINTSNKLFDMTNWYSSNNVNNDNGQESRFGLLRGQYDAMGYEAKPAYLSCANYMKLMIGAEFIDKKQIGDNITAYHYKLRDGRDALIAWAVEYSESAAIKLNANNITVYDCYGNEERLSGINNNYSLSFDIMPTYIVGHFSEYEKADSAAQTDTTSLEMVFGDKADFTITKNIDEDVEIQMDLPGNVTVVSNEGFKDNKAKIVLAAEKCDRADDDITVRLVKGGRTIYKTDMTVTYIPPISFTMNVRPYSAKNVDRWQVVLKIKGNFYDTGVAGKLEILSPVAMAKGSHLIDIPKVNPKEEKTIKLNIPKSESDNKLNFKARLTMGDYETVEIDKELALRCSTFVKKQPTIDGKIETGEWDTKTVMKMSDTRDYFELMSGMYSGLSDLSAKVYTGWDFDNFYLAAEVTDDEWGQDANLLWASDGIQFAMAPSKEGTQMAQLDIGKSKEGEQALLEISTNAANIGPITNCDFKMNREGNVTTYELRMPWKEIFPDGYTVRRNSFIPFSMLINDNDGKGREGFMENGGGIGVIKNVYDFLDLFLLF